MENRKVSSYIKVNCHLVAAKSRVTIDNIRVSIDAVEKEKERKENWQKVRQWEKEELANSRNKWWRKLFHLSGVIDFCEVYRRRDYWVEYYIKLTKQLHDRLQLVEQLLRAATSACDSAMIDSEMYIGLNDWDVIQNAVVEEGTVTKMPEENNEHTSS